MRAVRDHHVDRPGVEAQQCVKLTGTNRSTGLIQGMPRHPQHVSNLKTADRSRSDRLNSPSIEDRPHISITCTAMTWWSWRRVNTRSHPELGRENLQRRWYSVSRRGRVGRRQVFSVQTMQASDTTMHLRREPASLLIHTPWLSRDGAVR